MPIMSKDLVNQVKKQNADALAAAFQSGDEAKMSEALATFCGDVQDAILQQAAEEIAMQNRDATVMAARGQHMLTSAEMNYYTKLAEAVKSGNPKMALENFSVAMPQTIIDGVIEMIRSTHPLLDRINFRNTAYLTRFIMDATPGELATWGAVTDKVSKEITGSLKEINLTLCKLSVFMAISQDLVELGPQWLDQYIRETLAEAIAMALETAVVTGTGKNQPIGMDRDISSSASVQDGVQPKQTPTPLKSFAPVEMGKLVAKIARNPKDPTKARTIQPGDLIFLVNPFDYWNKVMPATSFQRADGTWIRDMLPIPAEIMQTAALSEGSAILGMPSRYFVGLGVTGKNGAITQDDSVRFLEDERAYKAKLQGNGRPMDEYAFLLLDIFSLEVEVPTPVTVKGTVSTKEQTE